jgi:spore coat protein U-like protein
MTLLQPVRCTTGSLQYRVPHLILVAALLVAGGGAWAQSCTFRNPRPGGIVFGSLDPSIANTRTATSNFRVQCTASASPSWTFSGSNGSAPLRMKHATQNAYIPYSAAASGGGGPPGNQQWTVTATIVGTDYQNAPVGAYTDDLTATITP